MQYQLTIYSNKSLLPTHPSFATAKVCRFIIMRDLESLAAGDGREDCSLPGLKKRPGMQDLTDYITDFMLTIKPRSLDLFQQQLTFTLLESVEKLQLLNIQTNDLPVFFGT